MSSLGEHSLVLWAFRTYGIRLPRDTEALQASIILSHTLTQIFNANIQILCLNWGVGFNNLLPYDNTMDEHLKMYSFIRFPHSALLFVTDFSAHFVRCRFQQENTYEIGVCGTLRESMCIRFKSRQEFTLVSYVHITASKDYVTQLRCPIPCRNQGVELLSISHV